jgi:hypothetical protein
MAPPHYTHPSGDKYLTALSQDHDILSSLVRSCPGTLCAQGDPSWLDDWFSARSQYYFDNPAADVPAEIPSPAALAAAIEHDSGMATAPCKLLELQPHYFRGFRALPCPITFSRGLVVIDGRNSSGKTSLAEALEWLFTGELVRRTIHGQGAPKELENCICNQLRPDGASTWVEAAFELASGEPLALKRVLLSDYGPTSTSRPSSVLYKDGVELCPEEETHLVDSLVLGIPPLLTQHSLRVFVQSSPSDRRNYFERLLRLDELTHLIEKAVIGDAHLPDFRSPAGSIAFAKWQRLKSSCREKVSKTILTRAERTAPPGLYDSIAQSLLVAGKSEFPDLLHEVNDFEEAIVVVRARQQARRQEAFPLLAGLRPKRAIDEQLSEILSSERLDQCLLAIGRARSSLCAVEEASRQVTDAEIAIAHAFALLSSARVITASSAPQTCPLCGYEVVPTLTEKRIQLIRSWIPTGDALTRAEQELSARTLGLNLRIRSIREARNAIIPASPSEEEWAVALQMAPTGIGVAADQLRTRMATIPQMLAAFDAACEQVDAALTGSQVSDDQISHIREGIGIIAKQTQVLLHEARDYAQQFSTLENAVASLSREDPDYSLREAWLDAANAPENIAIDISWEQAKHNAQRELASLREALIQSRKSILDARRQQFSCGMTAIWKELREDTYSIFSRLFIPEPRGKGFPVEIEVKAMLDDGSQQREVDALRVFSESQVHALGIAAFVTRAILLGHRTIILDDPVQSMDEDHFKTFASGLLPYLMDQDLQVIILTHNDTFSRNVSHAFSGVEDYTTMSIRHSRRSGCQVEEGNRRAAERLKKAEALGEEGKLEEAWRHIRLAIERTYLVAMLKHGPSDFDPKAWNDQTAEYMWNSGAGDIISGISPGLEPRLKDILTMACAGAHDKAPQGLTDLTLAIRDLRQLLVKLRIGSG